ncbi:hypothetical protein E4U43_000980 [Claviceps pusilla]|uniref:Uncharacterized protein n=1 Tax=Claviceps pusilla TaxID=123648 RepID=A0A9P7SZK1_9HYPO|nr:hypothetical protein E4U43_000980 [Claviceps pusilla]
MIFSLLKTASNPSQVHPATRRPGSLLGAHRAPPAGPAADEARAARDRVRAVLILGAAAHADAPGPAAEEVGAAGRPVAAVVSLFDAALREAGGVIVV